MNNLILKLTSVLILAAVLSCHKQRSPEPQDRGTDTTGIIGRWTWVRSNFLFNVLTPRSGVRKQLDFTATGAVYIKHNDFTGQFPGPYVAVPPLAHLVLLDGDVTDTLPYRFRDVPTGCPVPPDNQKASLTALVIRNGINQFRISNDTLYLITLPCLVQPDSVIYVRVKGGTL
jgi:hypothetical protein